jgi:tRNA threonylcarbamoyladenosine biosynthesis protein TsaB
MILALETSDILCSVAFWDNGRTLLEYNLELPQQHATIIGGLVEQGLQFLSAEERQKKYTADSIEAVGVAIGPGSFTGLRIGLSFAQGFCFGKELPIAGISNHQVLAAQSLYMNGPLFTAIEARRNEVYLAEHEWAENGLPRIHAHNIVAKNELRKAVPDRAQLVLPKDINIDPEIISGLIEKQVAIVPDVRFTAGILARLAQKKIAEDGPDTLAELEPMYIRPFAGVV